jgi:hypothetical protein
MEYHSDQHSSSWLRLYSALALQCNLNVLDAVYWTTPWNKEAVETHLNNQLDKGQIVYMVFEPVIYAQGKLPSMWVLVEYLSHAESIFILEYRWTDPSAWFVFSN